MLRLQSDERLVALVRRGHHGAFEALVSRYQSRLLAFCRHMLGSREDAEDVLQEVFAASYNAMLADDRPINVRPWLYRIARNRSLNHLRRAQAIGVDSMDIHLSENGATTADKVHRREDFRQLIGDVQQLAETQRTALLLREIDALSYEQIAEAMETTVPSVKSLLVRARVSLAEAAEARKLTCEEVRDELGEVAEGLRRTSPPVRRHLRTCDRCAAFRKQLRSTNRALALVFPVAPLLLFKKGLLAQLGMTASAGAGTAATGVAASASAAGGASMMSAGISTIATKAAASVAAAAIVTAGAVEVDHVRHAKADPAPVAAAVAPRTPAPAPPKVVTPAPEPVVVASSRQPADEPKAGAAGDEEGRREAREGRHAGGRDARGRRPGSRRRHHRRARADAAGRRLRDAARPADPAAARRGRHARPGRGRARDAARRHAGRARGARHPGDAAGRRRPGRHHAGRARGDDAGGPDGAGRAHDAGGPARRDDSRARSGSRGHRPRDPGARRGPAAGAGVAAPATPARHARRSTSRTLRGGRPVSVSTASLTSANQPSRIARPKEATNRAPKAEMAVVGLADHAGDERVVVDGHRLDRPAGEVRVEAREILRREALGSRDVVDPALVTVTGQDGRRSRRAVQARDVGGTSVAAVVHQATARGGLAQLGLLELGVQLVAQQRPGAAGGAQVRLGLAMRLDDGRGVPRLRGDDRRVDHVPDPGLHRGVDRGPVLGDAPIERVGADEQQAPPAGQGRRQRGGIVEVGEPDVGAARRQIGERVGRARQQPHVARRRPREQLLGDAPAQMTGGAGDDEH